MAILQAQGPPVPQPQYADSFFDQSEYLLYKESQVRVLQSWSLFRLAVEMNLLSHLSLWHCLLVGFCSRLGNIDRTVSNANSAGVQARLRYLISFDFSS